MPIDRKSAVKLPRGIRLVVVVLAWLFSLAAGQAAAPVEVSPAAGQTGHWAYEPIARPTPPPVSQADWPRNPLDRFILSELEAQGLGPSPEADKRRLIRRATLALTGLPPTPTEVEAFLADASPRAYERVVDRLLASPRYGEQMARNWLDLARYADTHGYHIDSHRDMWRWRDWVVESYNRNQPFDQFTVEQLAGDLLPNVTPQQRLATGFNRNNMLNFENGALAEEYLVEYVADRVVTTSTVWMAQTLQCARCHDHKYDPFTQRDFFQLFAYFNNVPEQGLDGRTGNAAPLLKTPTPQQQWRHDDLQRQLAACQEAWRQRSAEAVAARRAWEQALGEGRGDSSLPPPGALASFALDDAPPPPAAIEGPALWLPGKYGNGLLLGGQTRLEVPGLGAFERSDAFTIGLWVYPTTGDRMTLVARQENSERRRGYALLLDGDRLELELVHEAGKNLLQVRADRPLRRRQWQHVLVTSDGSGKAAGCRVYVDGVVQELESLHDALDGSIASDEPLRFGGAVGGSGFRGLLDEVKVYARTLTPTDAAVLAGSDPIGELAAVPEAERTAEQQATLHEYYLRHHDAEGRRLGEQIASLRDQLAALDRSMPTTMVMVEADPPRATHILQDGDYRSPGERVLPGTPASLRALPAGAPPNRLALARWLVDPRHPLTARVAVNREWQHFFGEGLVRTSEDFGTRGERPSHPALLDWLAGEFIRGGWDRKQLHRLIVTSATYRQSSRTTAESWERDPQNRLLARGPRTRLPAEVLRDSALLTAGLLVEQLGGPGVYPYQPKGLWKEVSYNPQEFTAQVYTPSVGADLYRRSLYTFWKRAVPPPPMVIFDAPDRETCTTRRPRTNTPLQALVLMNEAGFVEAARLLAERILAEAPHGTPRRIEYAFELLLARGPSAAEQAIVERTLREQRAEYQQDVASARQLLAVGQWPADSKLDPVELASWTIVASMLLNLDEGLHD
ncbi:MAG: DUF1553 domain-containing protein [Pirellulaceae bacterium]|nr:DUF1553 domain-containing protein [Pirellulaceae bacterium]